MERSVNSRGQATFNYGVVPVTLQNCLYPVLNLSDVLAQSLGKNTRSGGCVNMPSVTGDVLDTVSFVSPTLDPPQLKTVKIKTKEKNVKVCLC